LFSSTFVFAKKQYDAEFIALDAVIAEVAKWTPRPLGGENRESSTTRLVSKSPFGATLLTGHSAWTSFAPSLIVLLRLTKKLCPHNGPHNVVVKLGAR
jgi:hypothetical protein